MRVLVTAGPTREPLDPVRYLSNRSSGKMGYAMADAFVKAGHRVLLVFPDHTEALPEDEKHPLAPRIVREIEGLAALKAGA